MATATHPEQQGGDCPPLNLHDIKENLLDEKVGVDFRPSPSSRTSAKTSSNRNRQHQLHGDIRPILPPDLLKSQEALTNIPVSPPPAQVILYNSDRVVKLHIDGELVLGYVGINRNSGAIVVDWDDGRDEHLGIVGKKPVTLVNKMGILDRRSVGYGSKVTDGNRIGQVVEKRFLASLVLDSNTNVVIVDVPCEEVTRPGYAKMGDKVVYSDEWVGLVADTRAGIYFKMDKDGKLGYVPDDSYGYMFPRPGDKLKMMLYHLWDSIWITHGQTWWWNFFKYLGNSATILDTKIDCMTLAWMGNVNRGSVCKEEENALPPNTLRQADDLKEVRHLYGRNWKYMKEYSSWDYKLKKEDKVMDFHDYVVQLSNNLFFGSAVEYDIDMGSSGDVKQQFGLELEPEKIFATKVASCRSIVDIEWDDGTMDTLPTYSVQPYQYVGSDSTAQYFVGDIVCELTTTNGKQDQENDVYGFIVRVYQTTALVKWVYPDGDGYIPKVSPLTTVELSDVALHPNYLFLKSLHQLPVAVSKIQNSAGERIAVDGVKLGVVVGVDIPEAKLVIKCTNGLERLVWAHEFEHFEGDVAHDPANNKWIPWYKLDHHQNPIFNYCMADLHLQQGKKARQPLMCATVEAADEDASTQRPKLVKFFQALYSE